MILKSLMCPRTHSGHLQIHVSEFSVIWLGGRLHFCFFSAVMEKHAVVETASKLMFGIYLLHCCLVVVGVGRVDAGAGFPSGGGRPKVLWAPPQVQRVPETLFL